MNKQEKRRLQLNKRHNTSKNSMNQRRKTTSFAHPAGSRQVLSNDNTAIKAPLNKRIIALILAVVMIAGLVPAGLFIFKPKAEGGTNKAIGTVTMKIRVNGKDTGKTATVQPGEISAETINLGDYVLSEGAQYIKSVVYDKITKTETRIYSVGSINETDYYSINQNGYTGIAKSANDTLFVDFSNKFELTFSGATEANGVFTVTDGGTFTTNAYKEGDKWYIFGGEDLIIKEVTPNQDRTATKVTYTSSKTSGTERINNNAATVPGDMILANTDISVHFNEVQNYTVQDARYMSGSQYYAQYFGLDNHGGTSQSEDVKSATNSLNSVRPGENATFFVYSQKNTGSQDWELSMLSVNGVDLAFPIEIGEANAVSTPFGNKSIKVTYITRTKKFGGSDGPRTLYKVEVPNVHENIEVNYYFTNAKERKVIVKGLTGINQTAAAVENRFGTGIASGVYYTYTSNNLNVYDAWYHDITLSGANLILYTVKSGYNPYAISTRFYVNGIEEAARATNVTGEPVDVIYDAGKKDSHNDGRFNTGWRYWGKNNILENRDDYGIISKKECILTTIAKDSSKKWYAVALSQREGKNQQLYLDAPAYKYQIALDMNGGDVASIIDTDYSNLVETTAHTVADQKAYTYLPSDTPTRPGHVFTGWRLLDGEGNELKGTQYLYGKSDRVDFSEETIANAIGNVKDATNEAVLQIKFKAMWKSLKDADVTYVSAEAFVQNDVNNDGSPVYEQNNLGYSAVVEQQVSETNTALINDKTGLSGNPYYCVNSDSYTQGETDSVDDPAELADFPENQFVVKYDFTLHKVTVTNTVLGYPKTKNFPVSVVLTPPENGSPVTLEMEKKVLSSIAAGSADVTSKNGSLTYSTTLQDNGFSIPVPHGWTYKIVAPKVEGDYDNIIDPEEASNPVTATNDKTIAITTISDNSGIQTNKTISGPNANGEYTLTLESWATGQNYVKPVKSTTPLDIVLVIDQSGSMANEDMNPQFAEIDKDWTAKEAAGSDITYYYKIGEGTTAEYYPVQAETGDYFVSTGAQRARTLTGVGHASTVGIGSKPHYNVPTKYYFVDDQNEAHKVYFIVVGADLHYCVFAYYYVDDNDPVASEPEWVTNTGMWLDWDYPKEDLINDATWNTLVNEHRIKLVPAQTGQAGLDYSTNNLIHYGFMWGGIGWDDTINSLSSKTDTKVANRLYYVNDNGDKVYLSDKVINDSTVAYSGPLSYVTTGTKRVTALQEAVTSFSKAVAEHANQTGVMHRIAVAGFAGNERPGTSISTGKYNYSGYNKSFDYVNTGLFSNSGEFKNYQELYQFERVSSSNLLTNAHYYIDYNKDNNPNNYQPIVRINGNWLRIDNHNYHPVNPSNYDVFEPHYRDLSSVYNNAYMDIADNEGEINPSLASIIANLGYYGGTYTSYGMAMANQIFANNNTSGRKKVIVVFTDGEPGANGYDEAIAGEAVFDSELAKTTYDASIYTVGLFVGNPKAEVKTFMQNLSSEYNVSKQYVLKSNLNPLKTYYYYDSSNKKTYSASTEYQGESTLGWWSSNNEQVYPKETNNDSASGRRTFYEYSYDDSLIVIGSRHKYSAVYGKNIDSNKTYYLETSNTAPTSANKPVTYCYKWYDSDGLIVEPASTIGSGFEFFEYGNMTQNGDGVNYYQSAKNSTGLQTIFANISDSITNLTTTVSLDSGNSLFRDVISDYFDGLAKNNVFVSTVEGVVSGSGDNETVTWLDGSNNTRDTTVDITNDVNRNVKAGNTLEILGFDYSGNYVSSTRPDDTYGKKMVVTITGLKPKRNTDTHELVNGFNLASNKSESGIYELLYKDDDPTTLSGEEKLLKDFPIPKVNRPQYKFVVDGDDKDASYKIEIVLKDMDGNPFNGKYAVIDNANHPVELEFNNGIATWVEGIKANEDGTIILENIFQNLPEGYTVGAIVSKTGDNTTKFDYSVKVDNKVVKVEDDELGFEAVLPLPKNGSEIEITSTRKTANVTLREITTKTVNSDANYADPEKVFDIILTLKDGNKAVSGIFDGIEFDEDGKGVIQMRHEQQKTITLPVGCSLSIDVDSESQGDTYGTYLDSYADDLTTTVPTSSSDDTYGPKEVFNGMNVTVINSIPEKSPPTGILDAIERMNPFVWLAIVLCMIAASGFAVYDRRRRKYEAS